MDDGFETIWKIVAAILAVFVAISFFVGLLAGVGFAVSLLFVVALASGMLGVVDKGDSQEGEYLIQGGFWGGWLDQGFDERRGMGLP